MLLLEHNRSSWIYILSPVSHHLNLRFSSFQGTLFEDVFAHRSFASYNFTVWHLIFVIKKNILFGSVSKKFVSQIRFLVKRTRNDDSFGEFYFLAEIVIWILILTSFIETSASGKSIHFEVSREIRQPMHLYVRYLIKLGWNRSSWSLVYPPKRNQRQKHRDSASNVLTKLAEQSLEFRSFLFSSIRLYYFYCFSGNRELN